MSQHDEGPDLTKPTAGAQGPVPPPYQPTAPQGPPAYPPPPQQPPSYTPPPTETSGGWGAPPAGPPQGPPGSATPPSGGPSWSPPSGQEMQREAKGFFGALFDFSFNHFVTPIIIKVVYVIATVALGLGWLFFLVTAFATSAAFGLFVLVIGPIFVVLYLALVRMTLEFYLAVVRMSEDIHQRLPRG